MRLTAFLLFSLFGVSACNATTLIFDFAGNKPTGDEPTGVGTGYVSFADGLTNVTLPDITAFDFVLTQQTTHVPVPSIEATDYPTLASLDMTIGTNGLPTYVSLDAQGFRVSTFGTSSPDLFFGSTSYVLAGNVVFFFDTEFGPFPVLSPPASANPDPAATPEPTTVGLFALGLIGFATSKGSPMRKGN